MARALASLEGLSCGDAFGECFFDSRNRAVEIRVSRTLPPAPWRFTDDTMMAVSVCASLERHHGIEPEWLAESFARHYDPERGYGQAMNALLTRLDAIGAANWFEEAQELFDGEGSFGNGAAMRVAPVGAYFAHDWGWLWSRRRSRQLRRTVIRRALPAQLRLLSRRRLHGATAKRRAR